MAYGREEICAGVGRYYYYYYYRSIEKNKSLLLCIDLHFYTFLLHHVNQ
jgi:hypothetical protein